MTCKLCPNEETVSALLNGRYYSRVCRICLNSMSGDNGFSSGAQSFDRRRQYEDNAQDTVQPYNAHGINPEFYRLYPVQAEKIFTKAEIEQIRRKL